MSQKLDFNKLVNNGRVRILSILVALFLIAFTIRYANHSQLLFDPDSYLWYRLAMYFSGVKTQYFVNHGGVIIDTLRYFPTGRVLTQDLLLLPMFIGYSFKLLGVFGIAQTPENVLKYMFVIGPFFAGLTTIVVFFLSKELTGSHRVAALTSLFYAVAPYAMIRNTAGDTGQESIGDFLILSWLFLFFIATRYKPFSRKHIAFAAASGLVFALANYSWGGNIFYFGLISLSVLIYLIYLVIMDSKNVAKNPVLSSYVLMMPVGLIISHFLAPLRYSLVTITSFPDLLAYVVILLSIVSILSGKFNISSRKTVAGAIGVFFIGALVTGMLDKIVVHSLSFINGIFTTGDKGIVGNTVAYYRSTGFSQFKATFGILLVSIPLGILYVGREMYLKRNFKSLFILIWLIIGLIAFRWMIRLSIYLAFIMPLMFAIIWEYLAKKAVIVKDKEDKDSKTAAKFNYIFVILIAILFISPVIVQGTQMAVYSTSNDRLVLPWENAGTWIKNNTPANSILISWWDYGYYLQTFADRTTIVDGGNAGKPLTKFNNRDIDVAKAFTSPENEFTVWLKPYLSLSHPRPIYVLVSYQEFGKSSAINYIAKDHLFFQSIVIKKSGNTQLDQKKITAILQRYRITNYYIVNAGNEYILWAQVLFDSQGKYHPEWQNELLAKLLPTNNGLGKGLTHFKLVFQNGYVYVYKYIP
mgnify:CR=1 FL=1